MRKSLLAAACVLAFAVPLIAIAAFARPSDVFLFLANESGKPRDFQTKIYLRANADDGAPVDLFGTMYGSMEGNTPQNAKVTMHGDFTATLPEGKIQTGFDLLVHQSKIYGRIARLNVTGPAMSAEDTSMLDEVNTAFADKWFVFDATAPSLSGHSWLELDKNGALSVNEETLKDLVNRIADAAFDLTVTRFRTGYAALLTQKPHAVSEIARILAQFVKEQGDTTLQEWDLSAADLLADPDLQALEEEINRSLTVRLKTDVSNEGVFQFARAYVTFALDEEDIAFSFEGSLQNRSLPVYLEIPKNAEPLESAIEKYFSLPATPSGEFPPFEDDWSTPPEEFNPPVERPLNLPPPSPSCSPQGTVRGADIGTQEPCPGGRESRRAIRARNVGEFNY